MEKKRVHHLFNRRLAARAGVTLAVRKLEPAVPTHDLVLFLCCHHFVALPATDQAGEGKLKLRFRSWVSVAAKHGLHPVIVGSLLFTAVSLHSETKTRRIANLLTITGNYREIWKEFLNQPKLARVLDPGANLERQPVTLEEEIFVNTVIHHVCTTYYAMNDELLMKLEGSGRDIGKFFALPVPKAVWTKTKLLQNQDFAAFINSSLKDCSVSTSYN